MGGDGSRYKGKIRKSFQGRVWCKIRKVDNLGSQLVSCPNGLQLSIDTVTEMKG